MILPDLHRPGLPAPLSWRTHLPAMFRISSLLLLAYCAVPLLIYVAAWSQLQLNSDMINEYMRYHFLRSSLLEYGRFPLWCPYLGGGYPTYAHPGDVALVFPLQVLPLLLGEVAGTRLNIVLIYLAGVAGFFLFGRLVRRDPEATPALVLATVAYAASPLFMEELKDGNYNELLVHLTPLALYCYARARRSPPWLLATLLLFVAFTFFVKFALIYIMAALATLVLLEQVRLWRAGALARARFAPLAFFVIFCLLLLGLSLVRILPMAELLQRTDYGYFAHYAREQGVSPAERLVNIKYYNFLLYFVACAALVPAGSWLLERLQRRRPLGPAARSALLSVVGLALVAALGEAPPLVHDPEDLEDAWRLAAPPRATRAVEFHQVMAPEVEGTGLRTRRSLGYYNLLRGVGTIDWKDDYLTLPTRVRPRYFVDALDRQTPAHGYRGEGHLSAGQGRVIAVSVEPNRVVVTVETQGPATLVVNQNYYPGWRCDAGQARAEGGLLAVDLKGGGRRRVTFTFSPPLFQFGLAASGASLLAALYLCLFSRRYRGLLLPAATPGDE